MDEEFNPYAPPKSEWHPVEPDVGTVWQEGGKRAVAYTEQTFPARCIKCNHPTSGKARKVKLTWLHPGFYTLLLPGIYFPVLIVCILVFGLVAAVFRRKATVYVGLCAMHAARLWWGRALGWCGIALVLFETFVINPYEKRIPLVIFVLLILTWLLGTWYLTRTVQAKSIQGRRVHIKGCGKEFLASLPEYVPSALDE